METTKSISPLRQRMIEDMRMRQLQPDAVGLHPRSMQVHPLPRALAGHGHGRGSAQLSVVSGRCGHIAHVAQCSHQWAEVLLRSHARARRTDGQDAAGAPAQAAAGGAEPGRGGVTRVPCALPQSRAGSVIAATRSVGAARAS